MKDSTQQVMETNSAWRDFFMRWPPEMARNGALVASWGEQITFREFMTTDSLLLVERRTPDAVGARQVILPYDNIDSVKITDPVDNIVFARAGFRGQPAQK